MDIARFIPLLNVAALTMLMFSMGLQVPPKAIVASVRPPRFIVAGVIANYVLVPALAVALLLAFRPLPMVSVGFLILALCPGAPVSPPSTATAGGNVALAIGLMV